MAEPWYVSRAGQQYGPYSWEELVSYTASGNVAEADLVRSASASDWVRADQVPGLVFRPASPRPTAPPPASKSVGEKGPRTGRRRTVLLAGGGLLLLLALACGAVWVLLGNGLPGRDGGGAPSGDVVDDVAIVDVGEELPFWEQDDAGESPAFDDADWQDYPDRDEEEAAIAETLEGFAAAMRQGDLDGSVAYILEERQDAYRELFSGNPEAMASFADLISEGEMSFLSEYSDPQPYNRTAEYRIELDGFDFYVVFMKLGDTWVLYDF